jgi:two-component system NtrC family response regulator
MGAAILLIEDEADTQELIAAAFERAGEGFQVHAVSTARRALEHLGAHHVDCVLLDHGLPDGKGLKLLHRMREIRPETPVILVTNYRDASMVVEAMKLGAVHYVVKDGAYPRELVQRVREALGSDELHRALDGGERTPPPLRRELRERYRLEGLIGESPAIQAAIAAAERAAFSRARVLLQGETGTGKELFARAIHYHGGRASGPFVTVNCPAIPSDLFESELFGHVQGAFTGATHHRQGLFEAADGGTIFLDEIGELGTASQAKFLRVLEDGIVMPVGSHTKRQVHVRVIAATNRDLRYACEQATFRRDLYHRLNELSIVLPPLRERRIDIGPLFRHFVKHFAEDERKHVGLIEPHTIALLEGYSWPGNVRELRAEAHRVVSNGNPGERVTPALLSMEIRRGEPSANGGGTLKDIRRRVDAAVIRARFRECGYNVAATARSLGLRREWLSVKMGKLGIRAPREGS